jgi:hypothetical protein
MIIIKSKTLDYYAMTPEKLLEDPTISWASKGLLTWVCSHSAGYQLHVSTIVKHFSKEGRDFVYARFKELVEAGYMVKYQTNVRGEFGKVHWLASHDAMPEDSWADAIKNTDWDEVEGREKTASGSTVSGSTASGESVAKNNNLKINNLKKPLLSPDGETGQGDVQKPKAQKPKAPPCPHLEIIAVYNRCLPSLVQPLVHRWPGSVRAKNLEARWKEDVKHQNLVFWERYFTGINRLPHQMGENQRGWKADMGWLVKRDRFDEMVERITNAGRG